jgi:iron complex transport system ATP-binding protein
MSTNPVLQLENVSVQYGTKHVLKNISLEAQRGVFYAVVGLNGSGKTSLFKALTRTVACTGKIYLDGQEIQTLKSNELSRKISLLSQHNTIYAPLTVWEVVLMGRYPYTAVWQSYSSKDMDICYEALELTQTTMFKNEKIYHLSGGEAQRVWLAQKIAQNTAILLLDEPTQHLDIKQKELFFNLLNYIIREKQKTILMSTHDIEELHRKSGSIWYIRNQGIEVIENYTPQDVSNLKKKLLE